ncbi:hypothetical protein L1987_50544 [Smallanthus sonchifolius]|uniref:Uncharacterized protein n=1 Tax=Smallanthus sonchifolius TaxID=185202 RepID=A0ACB9ENG2_9ASTR|nr:hypothetical protein L1987_50544 [Smallanthus sonchifolius]
MKHQFISAAIIAAIAILLLGVRPSGACRLLDEDFEETWMKSGYLLLSSLQQRRPVKGPPGNGCNWTGNGGNPCVGSKKAAGRYSPNAASPPPPHELSQTLKSWVHVAR